MTRTPHKLWYYKAGDSLDYTLIIVLVALRTHGTLLHSFPKALSRNRMIGPAFVIVSATRSGSTTLYRALNVLPAVSVSNQPRFDYLLRPRTAKTLGECQRLVRQRLEEVFTDFSGIKHVFDPNGHPFEECWDSPTVGEMERNAPFWHELNLAILNYPGIKVVFLRRRDQFLRIVSDMVAQGSGHWGFMGASVSKNEAAEYKKYISEVQLLPLDEERVRWYVRSMPVILDGLRAEITNPVMDVWYEDLFGRDVVLKDRLRRFHEILEFLDIEPLHEFGAAEEIDLLFRPSAKLNSDAFYERIPNYPKLRNEFPAPRPNAMQPMRPLVQRRAENSRVTLSSTLDPRLWLLRAAPGCTARLRFTSPASMRIEILENQARAPYDLQLNAKGLSVRAGRTYRIRFRSRAHADGRFFVAVSRARGDWGGLGLYHPVEVSSDWSSTEVTVLADEDEDQARLHFDLGSLSSDLELDDITFQVVEEVSTAESADTAQLGAAGQTVSCL